MTPAHAKKLLDDLEAERKRALRAFLRARTAWDREFLTNVATRALPPGSHPKDRAFRAAEERLRLAEDAASVASADYGPTSRAK